MGKKGESLAVDGVNSAATACLPTNSVGNRRVFGSASEGRRGSALTDRRRSEPPRMGRECSKRVSPNNRGFYGQPPLKLYRLVTILAVSGCFAAPRRPWGFL